MLLVNYRSCFELGSYEEVSKMSTFHNVILSNRLLTNPRIILLYGSENP